MNQLSEMIRSLDKLADKMKAEITRLKAKLDAAAVDMLKKIFDVWINVINSLPEDGGNVLVSRKSDDIVEVIDIGYRHNRQWRGPATGCDRANLPEPPRARSNCQKGRERRMDKCPVCGAWLMLCPCCGESFCPDCQRSEEELGDEEDEESE